MMRPCRASSGDVWAFWGRRGPPWALFFRLGAFLLLDSRARNARSSRRRSRDVGSRYLNDSSGMTGEVARVMEGPEGAPTPCREARWRIHITMTI
eukprot:2305749-Pyramimonas_sp.AAC.1